LADVAPSELRTAKSWQKNSQLPKQNATLAISDDRGVPEIKRVLELNAINEILDVRSFDSRFNAGE
jgi:hypothetical protein